MPKAKAEISTNVLAFFCKHTGQIACASFIALLFCTQILPIGATANGSPTPTYPESFFPTEPPNVQLSTARGVLLSYGIGDHVGGLIIHTASGASKTFYITPPVTIGNVVVNCDIPPQGGSGAIGYCINWPSALVIGKTPVTVYYWTASGAAIGRGTVPVTNHITFGSEYITP